MDSPNPDTQGVTNTTDVLVNAAPGTVVIANSYLWWVESSGIVIGLSEADVTGDPQAILGVLNAGLAIESRAAFTAKPERWW